jgi:hypothetical protein
MRGRIREALCPELQALREGNRLLRADVEEALSVANYWHAIAQEGIKRANVNGSPARRPLTDEEMHNLYRRAGLEAYYPRDGAVQYEYERRFDAYARAIERAHKIGGNDE